MMDLSITVTPRLAENVPKYNSLDFTNHECMEQPTHLLSIKWYAHEEFVIYEDFWFLNINEHL